MRRDMRKIQGRTALCVSIGLTALALCAGVQAETPSNIELIKMLVDKGSLVLRKLKTHSR